MDPKDSFFKRLQPLENYAQLFAKNERFGSWNEKSIGIILVNLFLIYLFIYLLIYEFLPKITLHF